MKSSLVLALLIISGCSLKFSNYPAVYGKSPQFKDGGFSNSRAISDPEYWPILKKYWRGDAVDNIPTSEIPVSVLSRQKIEALPNDKLTIIRFGHSTTLVKIANQLWLIDPVFSQRASPFSFVGPKRFHQPPITIEALPAISGVIISHNHYDHLDKQAIERLRNKVEHFIVPLGLGKLLQKWGVDENKTRELDWWQSTQIAGLEITATPAQHFSGRGLFDRNQTLWASWVLKAENSSLFYSGDSGYFEGFKEIGSKHGPFDLVMLEVGAYDALWPFVHMMPAEAVQASQDLAGRHFLPVHNGTFDLAFHPWYEPFEAASRLAAEESVNIVTPVVGQPISFSADNVTKQKTKWWVGLK